MNIDYVAAFQAVTLDAAFQVAHINLEIVDDGINEGTENFQVFLSTSSPGCVIQDGVSPIDISIIDDDGMFWLPYRTGISEAYTNIWNLWSTPLTAYSVVTCNSLISNLDLIDMEIGGPGSR